MRNVLFLLLITCFFSTSLVAQAKEKKSNVNWMSWEEAVEASKKSPRKIFVDVYTDWCGWCKRMDKATFQNPEVAKYLNANFYPVKLNAEQKEDIVYGDATFKFVPSGKKGYHQLAAALLEGRLSFPTVVFLNEDHEILQRLAGFIDKEEFAKVMRWLAEDVYKETPYDEFKWPNEQGK